MDLLLIGKIISGAVASFAAVLFVLRLLGIGEQDEEDD